MGHFFNLFGQGNNSTVRLNLEYYELLSGTSAVKLQLLVQTQQITCKCYYNNYFIWYMIDPFPGGSLGVYTDLSKNAKKNKSVNYTGKMQN